MSYQYTLGLCNLDATCRTKTLQVYSITYSLWLCTFMTFQHLDYDTCILTIGKYIYNVRILCLSCNVKISENLSDLNKKDRNKRHSSPFINVVKGVFFVVRVTLVPVSYLSAPSSVHSYRVPGKFIRRLKSLFVG